MRFRPILLFLVNIFFIPFSSATQFNIGTILPDGIGPTKLVKKMVNEIKDSTHGEVEIKVFYNSSKGDELEMKRKISNHQLDGAVLSAKSLTDISPSFRSLEIPFNFLSNDIEANKSFLGIRKLIEADFSSHQLKSLAIFSMGPIYLLSSFKISNLIDLKKATIWYSDDDFLIAKLLDSLKVKSVKADIADVYEGLDNKKIDTVYAPPVGLLALQWNTKARFLIDLPIAYTFGSLVFDQKIWNKINPKNQLIINEKLIQLEKDLNELGQKDNQESLEVFKKMGLEFTKLSHPDIKELQKINSELIRKFEAHYKIKVKIERAY
jgi:TRAP-type C4-dicarboxylate transport system substrate-binding protein